jgi:hypothetical protein
MKAFKILGHPYLLIASFLFIIISGEHIGGFYLLYLLLGIFGGSLHSIAGIVGVLLLVIAYNSRGKDLMLIDLTGAALLQASLILFFNQDKNGYNDSTFHQTVPLVTLCIFITVWLAFVITRTIFRSRKKLASLNP